MKEDTFTFTAIAIDGTFEIDFAVRNTTKLSLVARSIVQRQGIREIMIYVDGHPIKDYSLPCEVLIGAGEVTVDYS